MDAMMNTLPAALLLGLSFGASACMLSCIPTLGVALLSQEGGAGATMKLAGRFNVGRLLGYSLLGLISGSIGTSITSGLNSEHAGWVFGALLMFSGLMLWRRGATFSCHQHGHQGDSFFKGSMFGMGVSMSLTPCAPLAGVCAAAAATGSPWSGCLLGWAFGMGAVIPAQLVLGYGLGAAGQQLRSQLSMRAPQLGRLGGGILLLTGACVTGGLVQL